MKIGFDLDGVIADHTYAKIKLAADLGFKITKKDTPSEILENILPENVLENLLRSLYNETHLQSCLMDGAKETINNLQLRGINYFLISLRKIPDSAIKFLLKNYLWPKYFNKSNTVFVLEKEDKNIKARELGITHYFDDETGVLEKLKSVENKFLFDNHNVFPKSGFYKKVSSWDEIKKQLL